MRPIRKEEGGPSGSLRLVVGASTLFAGCLPIFHPLFDLLLKIDHLDSAVARVAAHFDVGAVAQRVDDRVDFSSLILNDRKRVQQILVRCCLSAMAHLSADDHVGIEQIVRESHHDLFECVESNLFLPVFLLGGIQSPVPLQEKTCQQSNDGSKNSKCNPHRQHHEIKSSKGL